ncbi:MAG: helix-turn-helix domain-containing protein [Lachnospiraceae bacterium]|nr:helix-turn-helix domain-containing protein [Lachnospiraceae bacterium]
MDIGTKIKKYRESQNISQDELALRIFVSRQTISNWETNKSCPDIKSLTMLSNIFNVSLDDFIKGDLEEMKKIVEEKDLKGFNILGWVFTIELLLMVISVYPLFKFAGIIGIGIWVLFVAVTICTAFTIERIKKHYDIQTYKEIVAFVENKPLSYEESQQELGKRIYQKILMAIMSGVIAFLICLVVAFIINNL